jgi:hypothetical protein
VEEVAKARDAARGDITVAARAAWRSTAVAKLVALRDRILRGEA